MSSPPYIDSDQEHLEKRAADDMPEQLELFEPLEVELPDEWRDHSEEVEE